jgi:hypothetical protein
LYAEHPRHDEQVLPWKVLAVSPGEQPPHTYKPLKKVIGPVEGTPAFPTLPFFVRGIVTKDIDVEPSLSDGICVELVGFEAYP